MNRLVSYHIEERFTHVEGGAIEHERVGALLDKSLADRDGVAGGDDFVPVVAEREGQQFGDLGRVVDEQNTPGRAHFLRESVPSSRFFSLADGSRSITHARPPAVK